MTKYKCFKCEKAIKEEYVKKKIRCPYCGSKLIFKPRNKAMDVKAR